MPGFLYFAYGSKFLYFAYGSNMCRERIEDRLGPVDDLGWASLSDHSHRFDKHGADGTAKGNIVRHPGRVVHGVLYRLGARQIEALEGFEGGYRRVDRDVLHRAPGSNVVATTFQAVALARGLSPTRAYLDYYDRGMREHRLPDGYRRAILRGTGHA